MEKVSFGSVVKPLGIQRANTAENCKGMGILIEKDPQYKNIAYDNNLKRAVEVDQDSVIKYGLNPRSMYLFLIARLNTDMKGKVIGDDITVEYVSLSHGLYVEYTEGVEAVGKANAMMLTKVKKTGEGGQDYSYVKATAANIKDLPQGVKDKIVQIRKEPEAIAAMWSMIDSGTSLTIEQYEKLLAEKNGEEVTARTQIGTQKPPVQISSSSKDTAAFTQKDEFDLGQEFEEEDLSGTSDNATHEAKPLSDEEKSDDDEFE